MDVVAYATIGGYFLSASSISTVKVTWFNGVKSAKDVRLRQWRKNTVAYDLTEFDACA
jgi:hypothetical protein